MDDEVVPAARQPLSRVSVPRVAPATVRRPRIVARLAALVEEHAVTVVVGPAGAGKTTALATWAEAHDGPVAWLSLDRYDDDLARLHRALAGALLQTLDGAGPQRVARDAVRGVVTPGLGERVGPEHFEPLARALDGVDGVLVLDDVHELGAAGTVLGEFVRGLPRGLRVVLASRRDPRPLGGDPAAGEVGELGEDELAFDRSEVAQLSRSACAPLGDAGAARLHELTGGWPVAVRMTLTSMAGGPRPAEVLRSMDRADVPLADYLVEQVLSGLPDDVASFALRASCAETIDSRTASVLVGERGPALLAECRRLGLFLAPLGTDDGSAVFRWHALFAAQCQAILRRTRPADHREAHRALARDRASTDVAAAVAHATAAGDGALAASLVEARWPDLLVAGEYRTLRRLIDLVPAPWRDGPELTTVEAAVVAASGDAGAADLLARARALVAEVSDERRADMETTTTLVELFVASSTASLVAAVARGRVLLEMVDGLPAATAALALYLVGRAESYNEYDDDRALAHLTRGAELASAHGLTALELGCLAESTLPRLGAGDVDGAWTLAVEVERRVAAAGWRSPDLLAGPRTARGFVSYVQDRLDEARTFLEEGITALPATAHAARSRAGTALMAACAGLGDWGALAHARATVVAAQRDGSASPYVLDCAAVVEALAQAFNGRPSRAAGLVQGLDGTHRLPIACVWAAEVYRRAGRLEDAGRELARVPPEQRGTQVSVNWELTSALVAHADGQEGDAHAHLERALDDAAARGIRRPFAERDDVASLLRQHAARGTGHADLVAELLGRESDHAADASREHARPLPARELSERERAVLRLLRTSRSSAEIAAELFVSVNTVKTHQRSIYRKLGVGGRREALQAALVAGLLS